MPVYTSFYSRILTAAIVSCAGLSGAANAQSGYPDKPVRIIVPFSTGGASDVMGRLLSQKLSEAWGKQVYVENRPGAGGNIGMEATSRAAPDGYTMVLMNNAAASNAALNPKLSFDVLKDFTAIGLVASTPMVLVANMGVPATNLNELTELLKKNPGKFTYGSCGLGGPQHFAVELYKYKTGAFVVHAPYRGCSQAATDILGNQIELAMLSSSVAVPHAKAGRMRAIATTAKNRLPDAPEIPTFRESGIASLKDYEFDIWYGLLVPAATPKDIAAKIQNDVMAILRRPDMKQSMNAAGIESLIGSADDLKALYKADLEKSQVVVKFAQININ
jgi:tripartite-type tricarboxylate transporter receptor subunit TctC